MEGVGEFEMKCDEKLFGQRVLLIPPIAGGRRDSFAVEGQVWRDEPELAGDIRGFQYVAPLPVVAPCGVLKIRRERRFRIPLRRPDIRLLRLSDQR